MRAELPCALAPLLLAALAGAGCAALDPAPRPVQVVVVPAPPPVTVPAAAPEPLPPPIPLPAPAPPADAPPVAAVLAHADQLRGLGVPALAQEIVRLSALPASPVSQLQLALALVQTRVPSDAQRAVQLVQRVLAQDEPQARALHPLARLLQAQLGEQRRVEEQAERQAQQLRDAQRRIDQLNDRLDALRAIERGRPTR